MNPNKIKKTVILLIPFFIVATLAIYFGLEKRKLLRELKNRESSFDKSNKEIIEIKKEHDKIQKDFANLQKDYASLSEEHNSLISRIKGLLTENERAKDLTISLEKTKKSMELLEKTKQEVLEQNLILKEQAKDLQTIQKQLIREKEQLQETLTKEMDKSGIKKLEQDNFSLKSTNKNLESGLKQKDAELSKLKDSESKFKEESVQLNKKIDGLTKNYSEAVRKNKELENRVTQLPGKFAEISRQNQMLIKRTANMHYNMGVFYTQQKEYTRAVAEFEKAVELTPDDAYSHFNLGYIYAEYLVNRPKAIEHFRHYLRNVKKDDKDVDWVKKYIVTWESYSGNKKLE